MKRAGNRAVEEKRGSAKAQKRREINAKRHLTQSNPLPKQKKFKTSQTGTKDIAASQGQQPNKQNKIQPGEPLNKDIGAPTFTPQEFDIEKVEGLDCFIIGTYLFVHSNTIVTNVVISRWEASFRKDNLDPGSIVKTVQVLPRWRVSLAVIYH